MTENPTFKTIKIYHHSVISYTHTQLNYDVLVHDMVAILIAVFRITALAVAHFKMRGKCH